MMKTREKYSMKDLCGIFIRVCIVLSIFTASFDIVLNVSIMGLNFRFTQFIMLPMMVLWLINIIKERRIKIPKQGIPLMIWVLCQVAFSFRSPNLGNSISYLMWLFFSMITIFVICSFTGKYYSRNWLLKIYIESFVVISIIGLLQFALYFVGIDFFVQQKWIPGVLARINGFCFEPSYFATYLLTMFIVLSYCVERKIQIVGFSRKGMLVRAGIIGSAIVLSSSRMGILMIGIWFVFRFAVFVVNVIKGKQSKKQVTLFLIVIPVIVIIGIIILIVNWERLGLDFLFDGLGINGGSAHSANERINGLNSCLTIFKDSPILGYGLGGVDPIIAQYRGIKYTNDLNGMGMSILGESLVANGIIGLVPFVWYLLSLCKGFCKREYINKSMIYGFVFLLLILCFNQNILRPYVWIHMAILCVVKGKENIQGVSLYGREVKAKIL